MLRAMRNAYVIVFEYESRMKVAEFPSDKPNAAEKQANTARIATSRIGQSFRTLALVSIRGWRYA
jgi:hypothetical protein